MRSLLCFAVLALLPSCSESKTCTLVECQSVATIRMFANVPRAQMESATITACRNGSCSAGRPATVPSAPNDRLQFTLAGPVAAQGYLTSPDPIKGFHVEAVFPLDGVVAQDGDVYDLRVTPEGASAPAAAASDRATYQESQPNGSDCPPVCKTSTIEK
jgi:hypothetical protein